MRITFDYSSIDGYRQFLRAKSIPQCRFVGRTATFDDEYAELVIGHKPPIHNRTGWTLQNDHLFDYQREIFHSHMIGAKDV